MAIDFGTLLGGLTSGVTGALQGKKDRRDYEREAMRQLLADRVTNLNIGQLEATAAQRAADQRRRDALRASNPEYADLPDDVLDRVAGAQQKPDTVRMSPVIDPVTGAVSGYNPSTNELLPTGARVGVKPQEPKQPDAGERRGAALSQVAEEAYNRLQNSTPPSPADVAAGKVPMGLGNYWLSDERKNQKNAGAQLVSSYLYVISGATVTPQEAERQAEAILPQPNDGPDVLAQKARTRQTMIEAIRTVAGRAAPTTPIAPPSGTPQQGAPAASPAPAAASRKHDRFLTGAGGK